MNEMADLICVMGMVLPLLLVVAMVGFAVLAGFACARAGQIDEQQEPWERKL